MANIILQEAGTFLMFLLIIGICLFKDWLDGDLYWDSEMKMLTSRKVDRENSPARTGEKLEKYTQNNYNLYWRDLQNE